jgi:crotonobetainyl-CoA:carnitine CoA-transferase CaiB-like acyl-CoA transferase
MLLADMGADVIKVEEPRYGDMTRHMPPLSGGESHYFLAINRNKRGIAVDTKRPE